jgi:hypothetical protein
LKLPPSKRSARAGGLGSPQPGPCGDMLTEWENRHLDGELLCDRPGRAETLSVVCDAIRGTKMGEPGA